MVTTVTPLPTPPSRQDPSNFSTRADSFLAALPTFGTQLNTVASEIESLSTSAESAKNTAVSSASIATDARDVAVSAATTATNAPGTSSLSSSTITLGTGTKTLVVQTNKYFSIGQWVIISETADPSNKYMLAVITVYSAETGSMTVDVKSSSGSGVFSSWNVSLAAAPSIANPYLKKITRTSNSIITNADIAKIIEVTSGTFTQTIDSASSLGDGFWIYYRNSGTGVVTIDPANSETIDSTTSIDLYSGQCIILQCNGVSFSTVLIEGNRRLVVRDERASNSGNATTLNTGAWRTLTLNTIHQNSIGNVNLTSNVLTLPRGAYIISGRLSATTASGSATFGIRLYNTTSSSALLQSSIANCANPTITPVLISGKFSLTSQSNLVLELLAYSNNVIPGINDTMGGPMVFSEFIFEKVE